MRAINAVRRAGSIEAAVRSDLARAGIMHALVKHGIPYVLAGSIRDDGPLPGVFSDTLAAQDAMRAHTAEATFAVFVATALHAIAVGNMLPAFVDAPSPDGIRPRQQAARSRHAPGVRCRHQRTGLHARTAVLRRAMGTSADAGVTRPVGDGPGWVKVAEALRAEVPPAEIETLYLFKPLRREGREWGTAVVTRRSEVSRLRVYTVRYMLIVRGKERGRAKVELAEVGLSPADVIERVMRDAAERTGDTEPPTAVGPAVWYEG